MAVIASMVDQALRDASIPIVTIGSRTDRATWQVQFLPEATPAQRAAAQTLINTVAVDGAAGRASDRRDVETYLDNMSLVEKAKNLTILDQINFIRARPPTPLQAGTPAPWVQAVRDKVDTL